MPVLNSMMHKQIYCVRMTQRYLVKCRPLITAMLTPLLMSLGVVSYNSMHKSKLYPLRIIGIFFQKGGYFKVPIDLCVV